MGLTTTEEKIGGVGIVSCIIPYCFNPWGTGSHLYPANTNTLRSGHRVEVLLTLVGLPFSRLPYPLLLYPYCITTWGVCQEGFYTFFQVRGGLLSLLLPFPLDFSYIVPQLGWFVKRKFQRVLGFLLFPCQFPRTSV